MIVNFSESAPPLAALIVSAITGQKLNFAYNKQQQAPVDHAATLILDAKRNLSIRGNFTIAFYIATQLDKKHQLAGADSEQMAQIQEWIEFASVDVQSCGASDMNQMDVIAQRLNWFLQSRTYLVGYRLTLADLSVYEALKNKRSFVAYRARYGKELFHLNRWFQFLETNAIIQENVSVMQQAIKKKVSTDDIHKMNAAVAKSSSSSGSGASGDSISGDVNLPNAEVGKVCTRFPPEASGFLHIGHAKAALLNNYFARKYHGKLILRFDDTNPAKEKAEYEHAIIDDLKLLGIKPDIETFTSDSFDICLKFCEQMLREGTAYVDDTEKELFTEEKRNKIESKNRNNSVEKNLQMWEEMKNGTDYGRTCAVRAKFDMQADNATLRDPVLMRCKVESHPRTGDKYKVYPTYDFACPIVDSIEGVTHALRTSEYNDRNDQYYMICDALRLRKPFIYDYSRLNFNYTVMSKRKLTKLVEMGAVDGWDDARFPTVRGLVRRGLTVDALRNFVLEQGASRSIATMEWDKLWTLNKKVIDPVVPRFTALPKDRLVKFHITDGPAQLETKKNLKHKKNTSLGEKDTYYYNTVYLDSQDANAIVDNEEITLMDWGNAFVRQITKDANGNVVELSGVLNPTGSVKTTKKRLTWIPANDEVLIPVKVFTFDHIITKAKVEPTDDFEKIINQDSKHEELSVGDFNLKQLKQGDIIQLERRGYYRVDKAYENNENTIVLFNIPA